MPSTLTAYATFMSLSFFAVNTHARSHDHSSLARKSLAKRAGAMTYQGCFSSSSGLSDQGTYQYQTNTYCSPICVGKNQAVFALSGGNDCWCGDDLPPAASKVDDSNCNTPCFGFGTQNCGGTNFWSVYLSGTTDSAPNYGGSDSSSSAAASSAASSPSTSSSSTSAASSQPAAADSSLSSSSSPTAATAASIVVTSVAPGTTIVVTESASHTASSENNSTPTPANKSSHPSVAGIAAGVVVGILALAALAGGLFYFLRRKRQQAAEDEHKRSTQVRDFMRGGSGSEPKPPGTAYSNMSDMRLDPEAGARRNSAGSIADDQDYSRKILRVANPDDD